MQVVLVVSRAIIGSNLFFSAVAESKHRLVLEDEDEAAESNR